MELEEDISISSKLTDIKLSEEKGDIEVVPNEETSPLKRNSLKRFFKMPIKKGNDAMPDVAEKDGPSADSAEDADVEKGEGAVGPKEKEPPGRFHLRLGPVNKHQSLFAKNTGNTNVASGSNPKPGLKGSISNYWNLLFKRSQATGNNDKGATKKTESEEDEEEEISEKEIQEEVHQLSISEEPEEEENKS